MAEKISKASWTAFVQSETKNLPAKVDLADKELLKALASFDKTDERDTEPRLEALKELAKEIPKQVATLGKLKKQLGDKAFGKLKDRLYGMLEEAEALQKKTQSALDAEDEEDEDSKPNALLDRKLLLRQLTVCRRDPERTMKFAFVDAKGKEQPAVLAMHPRMGSRALFAKLQAAAGVKTGAYGTAWVDGMSLMLRLDKPLSGLVKKVRPPVKACGFKISKAVLWNADGTVFEQDDLPEDAVGEASAQGAPAEAVKAAAPTAPPQPSVTYEAKLAALMPRVTKAADDSSVDVHKHKALLDFAAGKARDKDYIAAVGALRRLEQLLDSPTPMSETGSVDAGVAFKARLTALLPLLKAARAAGRPGALSATAKATEAGMSASKGAFGRANELLDDAEAELAAGVAAGVATAPAGASGRSDRTEGGEPGAANVAVARWTAERDKVAVKLLAEIKAVVDTKDPLAANAELELKAILRQLNSEVATRRQAAEMDRYLNDDGVVADVSELAFDLKTPLLRVLGEISPLLPA